MQAELGSPSARPTVRALNLYYARALELRDEILATRLRASQVRVAIGIPHGRVFRCAQSLADLPDVMWDCPFADAAGHDHDMDARAASPEFEAVRAHMRAMLRRFGRALYTVERAPVASAPYIAGSRMTQLWLMRTGPAPIARAGVFAALTRAGRQDVTVLHRQGIDEDLPDWIIELPTADSDAASSILASKVAAIAGTRALSATWEWLA